MRRIAVKEHVHPGQRPGRYVILLAVDRDATRRLVGRPEQERPRTAGGVVDRLVLARIGSNADDLRHDSGNLRRRVELPFALATLGGEVPHEVFVGVAEQVVAFRPVGSEVQ